jgi:hypothetical protein
MPKTRMILAHVSGQYATERAESYTRLMTLRERVWEDLAADLEYHPKRGLLYLCLAAAAFAFWACSSPDHRVTSAPLVFLVGGVALLLKGLFLFRKSSEGLALTQYQLDELSAPSNRKVLPPVSILAAQIIQDFGTGALLAWPDPALPQKYQ